MNVFERQWKSGWYKERDAQWAAEKEAGKTYKQIALENYVSLGQVYKCVRRVRFLELKKNKGRIDS